MELKLRLALCTNDFINVFELNLYGIEIVTNCALVQDGRTFELNLYGIEMRSSGTSANKDLSLN